MLRAENEILTGNITHDDGLISLFDDPSLIVTAPGVEFEPESLEKLGPDPEKVIKLGKNILTYLAQFPSDGYMVRRTLMVLANGQNGWVSPESMITDGLGMDESDKKSFKLAFNDLKDKHLIIEEKAKEPGVYKEKPVTIRLKPVEILEGSENYYVTDELRSKITRDIEGREYKAASNVTSSAERAEVLPIRPVKISNHMSAAETTSVVVATTKPLPSPNPIDQSVVSEDELDYRSEQELMLGFEEPKFIYDDGRYSKYVPPAPRPTSELTVIGIESERARLKNGYIVARAILRELEQLDAPILTATSTESLHERIGELVYEQDQEIVEQVMRHMRRDRFVKFQRVDDDRVGVILDPKAVRLVQLMERKKNGVE